VICVIYFCRCLIDWEPEPTFHIPIILALYQLGKIHPTAVYDLLGRMIFDYDHYSYGQRLNAISRIETLMELCTSQKCVCCLVLPGLKKCVIDSLYPSFYLKYVVPWSQDRNSLCIKCKSSVKAPAIGKITQIEL